MPISNDGVGAEREPRVGLLRVGLPTLTGVMRAARLEG
jgi:hypothetical protein